VDQSEQRNPVAEMIMLKQQRATVMKKEINRMLKKNARSQRRELKILKERCHEI